MSTHDIDCTPEGAGLVYAWLCVARGASTAAARQAAVSKATAIADQLAATGHPDAALAGQHARDARALTNNVGGLDL